MVLSQAGLAGTELSGMGRVYLRQALEAWGGVPISAGNIASSIINFITLDKACGSIGSGCRPECGGCGSMGCQGWVPAPSRGSGSEGIGTPHKGRSLPRPGG